MKKIKLKAISFFLVITLSINITYGCVPVYADEYLDGLEEVLYELLVFVGAAFCASDSFSSGDFNQALHDFYLAWEKHDSGLTFEEWLSKNYEKSDNGQIDVSEDLLKFLQEFAKYYADQHPDEVEKINYRIIHTLSYQQAFDRFIAYEKVFDKPLNLPDGCNSLAYWNEMWNSRQTDSFPSLITYNLYSRISKPENVQDLTVAQSFSFFEGYEQGKTICLIGDFGGQSWGAEGEYHIGIYTYDALTGSLSVDYRRNGFLQSCRFVWDESEEIWNATENYHAFFDGGSNAYINMSGGFWGGGWGYFAQNPDPDYSKRYLATFNSDGTVEIPVLATPNGSSFRLFASEQDALRYFETCANSGLNFDPNQIYTGGSITINNNGDVTINNNPPGGGDDNPGSDSSGILGVLQDIRDWVKKIYNQVVIGNVINAIDALANVLDTAKNYFDEALEDTAAVAALSEGLSNKFPLSIPADILAIVTVLEAPPQDPVFTVPFKADFGGATGIRVDEEWVLDFTMFDSAIEILKWWLSLMYLWGLVMITPKFILMINGVSGSGGGKN